MWNPDTGADTKCPAMEPMCQIMFYNQFPTSGIIHKWTLAPEVGWFHIGVDTKCPAMELMCSIMLYNQLPTSDTIHKWTLAPEVGWFDIGVDTKCPAMELMCSIMLYNQLPTSDTNDKWTMTPYRCPHRCGTRTLGLTPSVRPWNRYVKSCFIMNYQFLTQFTS